MSRGYDYNRDLVPISSFEGEHWRTLQPYVDNSLALSPENKYLLCMSRLLTGNDTCSAIYKVSDGTYLVSNNTGDQSHYDRVVGALGNLATTGDIKATRRELESIFSHPTAAQVVTAARGVKGLAAFKLLQSLQS